MCVCVGGGGGGGWGGEGSVIPISIIRSRSLSFVGGSFFTVPSLVWLTSLKLTVLLSVVPLYDFPI